MSSLEPYYPEIETHFKVYDLQTDPNAVHPEEGEEPEPPYYEVYPELDESANPGDIPCYFNLGTFKDLPGIGTLIDNGWVEGSFCAQIIRPQTAEDILARKAMFAGRLIIVRPVYIQQWDTRRLIEDGHVHVDDYGLPQLVAAEDSYSGSNLYKTARNAIDIYDEPEVMEHECVKLSPDALLAEEWSAIRTAHDLLLQISIKKLYEYFD